MITFDLGLRDPCKYYPLKRIPGLSKLEIRLYNALTRDAIKTGREYLSKDWLFSKSKRKATVLRGRAHYNPMSGDLTVTIERKAFNI